MGSTFISLEDVKNETVDLVSKTTYIYIYILFSFPILVFHLNMFLLDFVLISNEKHNITQICQMVFFVLYVLSAGNFHLLILFISWFGYSFLAILFVLFVERFLDDMNLDCMTGIMRVFFS